MVGGAYFLGDYKRTKNEFQTSQRAVLIKIVSELTGFFKP